VKRKWRTEKKSERYLLKNREIIVENIPKGSFPPWAILYPAGYEVGMASLGFHSIIAELRSLGVGVERFFNGSFSELSFDSGKRISDFPIISVSVAYEPDLVSVHSTLAQWGIPSSWKSRSDSVGPVLGFGGALTYINPLVFSGIADWVVLGDGEPVIEHIVRECRSYLSHGDRRKLWEKLAEHESIFVPPLHQQMLLAGESINRTKSYEKDINNCYGRSLWVTPDSVFGRTVMVELQRGCARGCSYCTIPSSFGPVRFRSLENVKDSIESAKRIENIKIGLVTPEAGDYPFLPGLLSYLEDNAIPVSFASLRVDNMTERMVQAIVRSNRMGLTVAPETGSDALRKRCGKYFDNSIILKKLLMARKAGVRYVKLYFMVGLPTETDEDVLAIAGLAGMIRKELHMGISLSVNAFVPKPLTPWGNQAFTGIRGAERKFQLLKRAIAEYLGKGCEARFSSPREAELEYRLSWAGPEAVDWMENLVEKRKRGNKNAI